MSIINRRIDKHLIHRKIAGILVICNKMIVVDDHVVAD